MTEELEVTPVEEVEEAGLDLEKLQLALFQETQRCMENNDRFLKIHAQNQEIADMITAFCGKIGAYASYLFPHGPDGLKIELDETQQEPIMFLRMSDEESVLMADLVRRFGAFVNKELAPSLKLHQITVDGPAGTPFTYTPLVYDSATIRQAVFTAFMERFLDSESQSKIITLPRM